jgi:uncharacterized protein YciI
MNAKRYTPIRITLVLLAMACLLPAQETEQKKEQKPAFQLETFFVAIMSKTASFDAKRAASFSSNEQRYWQAIADRGNLILGGPTASSEHISAAFAFRAGDKDEASRIAEDDPLVAQHLWTATVLPWGTQKDFLQPLKNYNPTETYYLGFLKRGAKWSPEDTPERQRIQDAHLKNIRRLHEMGKLVAAGPFLEDTDLRGIFVFKTATWDEANELTNSDPAVQAGRLRIELHEWKLPVEAFHAK